MDDLIKRENEIIGDKSAEMNVFHDDKVIEIRKKKIINFLIQPKVWVAFFLIIAILLGIYIRTLPMQDHTQGPVSFSGFLLNPGKAFGGTPGLWDITTQNWTLGPDLDPWLFLRTAESVIKTGSFPKIDMMRNVPLGFDNSGETMLLPLMIDWTYHLSNFFYSGTNPEFAGVLFPVLMFVLTIISFFLFVREVFVEKSKESKINANAIALISTFLMIVVPIFLSRTVAGIPEKESAAFFFMFLAYFFFLKAWKSEKLVTAYIYGALAGITTAIMGLIWGGVLYIYIPIAVASLAALILNKVKLKEVIIYGEWIILAISISVYFSNKTNLITMLTSLASGLAFLVFITFVVHLVLWNTKLSNNRYLSNLKLPKNIVSIIISIILVIVFASILIGPSFVVDKAKAIHQMIFRPVIGRWNTTVAENRQPFFTEWRGSFGPFLKLGSQNIPIMFWLFVIGSVVLFRNMLNKLRNKDAWILTGAYVILLLSIIFSRYSSASVFNGDNFISKAVYYCAFLLFAFILIKIYLEYYKRDDKSFEKIRYDYLVLLSLLILTVFTSRGAVRLIMVLAPIAPIFIGYLVVESVEKYRKAEDKNLKLIYLGIVVVVIFLTIYIFYGMPFNTQKYPGFYQQITSEAFSFVPSSYNQQWQKAMQWVREETPEDAVFAHWWDYGYWVQSIGKRATVLDGGNAITFWNYYMGRLVLTGDNQHDALEFLYNHNSTHLLIDSSDIGKYGAYAQIGSDENFDRLSYIGTYFLDEKQIQETQNTTIRPYIGGYGLDEDLVIEENGKEIMLPAGQTSVGAIMLPYSIDGNNTTLQQPYVIMIYQGVQHNVKLRYIIVEEKFFDFGSGIEATAYIFPSLSQQGQGISVNRIGVAMFITPRLMRGMMSQIYILNDPLKKFPNFKLAHTQQSLLIEGLESQGLDLPDFVYFQGIQGPIKIWEIEYTGDEEVKQEYLDKDPNKYLNWQL